MSKGNAREEQANQGIDRHNRRQDEDDVGQWHDPGRKGITYQLHLQEKIAVDGYQDQCDEK